MDLEELYAPYAAMASLEDTVGWLQKQAAQLGIHSEIMNKAFSDTFLEMEAGKVFPTDGRDTGFDGVPHAVLNHYMLKKMLLLHEVSNKAYHEATAGFLQARIDKANGKGRRFFNCNHSPVLKALRIV